MDNDALDEIVRIRLPADFKIDDLPKAVKIESPFGKYAATWALEGEAVVFRRSLEIAAQTVPSSQYAELKRFADALAASAEEVVVLVR